MTMTRRLRRPCVVPAMAGSGLAIGALLVAVLPSGGSPVIAAGGGQVLTPVPCGKLNPSMFTLVTPDQIESGQVTSTFVAVNGTAANFHIILNEAGDYTDRHIQFDTTKYAHNPTFANSLASESVQEFRWSYLPQKGASTIAYGILRYDVYHHWYELHPAYAYSHGSTLTGTASCAAPTPGQNSYNYTPQTVTQIATGQFPFPRCTVVGTVVKVNPTTPSGIQSFTITDGSHTILVQADPQNPVKLPAVGQKVKVLGIPRQVNVHSGPWEINPAFQVSTNTKLPVKWGPPTD